jgi:putative ABC transport system permease protein
VAIGAEPAAVVRLVLGQGLSMAAIGVAAGGTIALWATKLLAGTLYGVATTDPVTYLGAAALLLAVSAAANAAPALRAARVDPMIALRQP